MQIKWSKFFIKCSWDISIISYCQFDITICVSLSCLGCNCYCIIFSYCKRNRILVYRISIRYRDFFDGMISPLKSLELNLSICICSELFFCSIWKSMFKYSSFDYFISSSLCFHKCKRKSFFFLCWCHINRCSIIITILFNLDCNYFWINKISVWTLNLFICYCSQWNCNFTIFCIIEIITRYFVRIFKINLTIFVSF